MRIVVAFHDLQASEASDLGEAFWLADTPINRARAEEVWATDSTHPNSAVFDWGCGAVEDDDILERLEDVCLHHPSWSEVRFLAVALTPELQARLHGRGITAELFSNGFSLKR
jgi:hypothetical protein